MVMQKDQDAVNNCYQPRGRNFLSLFCRFHQTMIEYKNYILNLKYRRKSKDEQFGEKVRGLREEKGLSRPVFCGDESELSVRQLVRIEKGEFRPTIKTLEYIADRLEIPSYVLMPDYKELPKRYQELKYFLLHHPDYGDKELQEQKEEYFDEIFENFL